MGKTTERLRDIARRMEQSIYDPQAPAMLRQIAVKVFSLESALSRIVFMPPSLRSSQVEAIEFFANAGKFWASADGVGHAAVLRDLLASLEGENCGAPVLTEDEREAVEGAIVVLDLRGAWRWAETLRAMLARSEGGQS